MQAANETRHRINVAKALGTADGRKNDLCCSYPDYTPEWRAYMTAFRLGQIAALDCDESTKLVLEVASYHNKCVDGRYYLRSGYMQLPQELIERIMEIENEANHNNN